MRNRGRTLACCLGFLAAVTMGCKKAPSDAEAIRAGITQHLTGLKTLNLSAMDMDVSSVSIQGSQARAQVTFRPKVGAPPGAQMQMAYQLEKRDSAWVVTKTEAAGGAIDHPAANTNPHVQPGQGDVHGNLPDLRELVNPANPPASGTLPPGHPPIDPAGTGKKSNPNEKSN
jgi:hypothetical protein